MLKNNIYSKLYNPEQWKYSNFKFFEKLEIYESSKVNLQNKNITHIEINHSDISIPKDIEKNISINFLSDLKKNEISKKIKQVSENESNPFLEMNLKNKSNGIFIHIKENVKLIKPLEIKYKINNDMTNIISNNRLFISIGENTSAEIIISEEYSNTGNLNSLVEVFIDKNSNLDIIFLSKKNNINQIYNFSSTIADNSTLNLFPIDIQGKLIKKNYFIFLNGKNSSINYNSLNLMDNSNHIDNYIKIEHLNNFTNSNTCHKNILKDKSKGIFYTKAKINEGAVNSEVNQKNNNLMLSNQANVHSNPQLEIYNNDVKCTHGSTTGQVDDEIIFYMQSRGLEKDECKKLILQGFSDEVLNKIKNDTIRKNIQKKINNWIIE